MKKINDDLSIPIIQGGMGVGVSLGNLAGHVARCGGMGVISTVNAGYREADFKKNPLEANLRALKEEIKKAFNISEGNGMVAINAMVEVTHYEEAVQTAVEEGIDAVISGAGLPLTLPKYTKGTDTLAAPIVSSGKAAAVICKSWDKRYEVIPDFIVIEGANAGGHLGFSKEEVTEGTAKSLDEILAEVLEAISPYEEKYGRSIPVFVGGGVFDGADLAHLTAQGASGVQIGTRFIATEECDASEAYKEVILSAKESDTCIIDSPVGMPARAIKAGLFAPYRESRKLLPNPCNNCLSHCPKGEKVPYCISRALIEAVSGNTEDGLFFCGSNVGRINEMTTVRDLMDTIVKEWKDC